jgi:hypothetical protein
LVHYAGRLGSHFHTFPSKLLIVHCLQLSSYSRKLYQ